MITSLLTEKRVSWVWPDWTVRFWMHGRAALDSKASSAAFTTSGAWSSLHHTQMSQIHEKRVWYSLDTWSRQNQKTLETKGPQTKHHVGVTEWDRGLEGSKPLNGKSSLHWLYWALLGFVNWAKMALKCWFIHSIQFPVRFWQFPTAKKQKWQRHTKTLVRHCQKCLFSVSLTYLGLSPTTRQWTRSVDKLPACWRTVSPSSA